MRQFFATRPGNPLDRSKWGNGALEMSPGSQFVWHVTDERNADPIFSLLERSANNAAIYGNGATTLTLLLSEDAESFLADAARRWPPLLSALLGLPPECVGVILTVGAQQPEVPATSLQQGIVELVGTGAEYRVEEVPSGLTDGVGPTRLRELAPEAPVESWLRSAIAVTDLESLCAEPVRVECVALRAGVYQWHDVLDASHSESQSIEGAGRHRNGDYWHGIMHRREPDDSNAKYWFRRVGDHPVFPQLARSAVAMISSVDAPEIASRATRLVVDGHWDPFGFIDFCSEARTSGGPQADLAQRLQMREMELLLAATYEAMQAGSANAATGRR